MWSPCWRLPDAPHDRATTLSLRAQPERMNESVLCMQAGLSGEPMQAGLSGVPACLNRANAHSLASLLPLPSVAAPFLLAVLARDCRRLHRRLSAHRLQLRHPRADVELERKLPTVVLSMPWPRIFSLFPLSIMHLVYVSVCGFLPHSAINGGAFFPSAITQQYPATSPVSSQALLLTHKFERLHNMQNRWKNRDP